jgi:ACS family hexuronate transporter-like MFS transporter
VQPQRLGRYRWGICVLLLLITVNNYMDRQVFSVAAPSIIAEYGLSNSDVATIATAFLVAYTVGQLLAGIFVDYIGARRSMSAAVVVWCLMTMLMPLGRSVLHFSLFRFLLGLSESVNFPAGVKVCAEWFPTKERATAVGIFQSGSAVGAMITPIIAAFIITHFGWQAAFVIIALPGLFWIPFWLRYYTPLVVNERVSDDERGYIWEGQQAEVRDRTGMTQSRGPGFSFFAKQRLVIAVALSRFFEEPAGWFYFTWLPIYLKNYRDVSLMYIGALLVVPFLTFDIGKVGGGWASSRLIKTGWTLDAARKIVMLVSALCMVASIPAMWPTSTLGFVLLISIATFGHGCWATTTQTIPGDIVAPRYVGTVYGITAFAGGIGAIVFMLATGRLVDSFGSFMAPFMIVGVLPLLGYVIFTAVAGTIRPITTEKQV